MHFACIFVRVGNRIENLTINFCCIMRHMQHPKHLNLARCFKKGCWPLSNLIKETAFTGVFSLSLSLSLYGTYIQTFLYIVVFKFNFEAHLYANLTLHMDGLIFFLQILRSFWCWIPCTKTSVLQPWAQSFIHPLLHWTQL